MSLVICYHCKNKSPKENMISLEINMTTNPDKPKKQGYRYYHQECYRKKPTYFHLKLIFETEFKEILTYIDNKINTGELIPFKDVSDFLYCKLPYKVWRVLFDDSLMKYIRKEMKQSVLDYAAEGYLQGTLYEYNLTRQLYIVARGKGEEIREFNGGLYADRRK